MHKSAGLHALRTAGGLIRECSRRAGLPLDGVEEIHLHLAPEG